MKISFDGLRQKIAEDFNELSRQFEMTLEDWDNKELRPYLNDLRQSLGVLMSCYDSKQMPDDFNDLTEKVKLL